MVPQAPGGSDEVQIAADKKDPGAVGRVGEAELLQQDVLAALLREQKLDACDIEVTVHDGRVILSGRVGSRPELELALRTAWRIVDPESVDCELLVHGHSQTSLER